MVKIKEFSEAERLKMFEMRFLQKKKFRDIAKEFQYSHVGVMKIVNKIQTKGTARNLARSGRKRCTTKRTDRNIVKICQNDRKLTAEDIRQNFASHILR